MGSGPSLLDEESGQLWRMRKGRRLWAVGWRSVRWPGGLWLARRGRLWLRGAGAGAGAEGKVGRDHRERERSAEGMGRSVEMGGGGRKATTSVYLCRVFLVCFAKAKGGRGAV